MVHSFFWRTSFILTALLMLSNSATVESNADMKSNLHFNEFLKPLNERLANERTSFPGSETIDQQITRFMETSNITGVSVAIVQDERLVYTNAFGYADREE
jgi:CubicO group peptidase (beta-lactamase class C family)